MTMLSPQVRHVLDHPWRFAARVFASFRANQGFLLAGAVAYNTLLSIVPMFALILVLLLFISLAFTVLENAMSVVFFHRVVVRRRHFLVSAIIPYCYISLLAVGLLLVNAVSGALAALGDRTVTLPGRSWSLGGADALPIYLLGVLGEVILLTSLYLVMPVGRLALRHALIGGAMATLLWEVTRHAMVWYFSTLSMVNFIYGSFTAAIAVLLSLEAGAIILLLGAQVIAEYERIGQPQAPALGLGLQT